MEEDGPPKTVTGPGQDRVKQLEAKLEVYEARHAQQTKINDDLRKLIQRRDNSIDSLEISLKIAETRSRVRGDLLRLIGQSGTLPLMLIEMVLNNELDLSPRTPVDEDEDYNEWEEE